MFTRVFSLIALTASTVAGAQTFNSGSTGADGPINVTSGQTITYPVPPDGIINATTVTVASGRLQFACNEKNTPVYLLATGDVSISGFNGVISVEPTGISSGLQGQPGGCGGFAGGEPGVGGGDAGDGHGPGGGKGWTSTITSPGHGSYGTTTNSNPPGQQGAIYGSNLLVPLVGGSGGGGTNGRGGAGGGGALLIASNTRIVAAVNAGVSAAGGSKPVNSHASGSGGAVRLIAPRIEGAGFVDVSGGASGGGRGRIRLDTLDRSAFNLSGLSVGTYSIGSLMEVFPTGTPALDFTNIAGTGIPDGSNPVPIALSAAASPSQTLVLRARNFKPSEVVAVRVVLTPQSGPRIVLDDTIDMAGQPTATKVFNFTMQPDTLYRVHAWTR